MLSLRHFEICARAATQGLHDYMCTWLAAPWPWYVAGPIIGLFVPVLLLVGNKQFGISSNLRHLYSALLPGKIEYFRYDWKSAGLWSLAFVILMLGNLGRSLERR